MSTREERLTTLLTLIQAQPGRWSAGRLHKRRLHAGQGPVQRGTARRDLAELARRGHLAERGPADGRWYEVAAPAGGERRG
ncbi:hypothetical protein [Streptomyces sp. NPDC002132]|uniref:hypothetical protein n=1 Tax=unclassified Streptomyces TaxID=2593676 RepID=UPI00332C0285